MTITIEFKIHVNKQILEEMKPLLIIIALIALTIKIVYDLVDLASGKLTRKAAIKKLAEDTALITIVLYIYIA